jgi:hypothetical protein
MRQQGYSPFAPCDEPLTAERRIWLSVIVQALADATSTNVSEDEQFARAAARRWFKFPSHDLATVCDNAGLEMEKVLAFAQQHIAAADSGTRMRRVDIGLVKPQPKPRQIARYEYEGQNLSIREWAELTGIPEVTLRGRLKDDWPIAQALGKEPRPKRKSVWTKGSFNRQAKLYTLHGESHSLSTWSVKLCIPYAALQSRLKRGWSVEAMLTTPHRKHAKNPIVDESTISLASQVIVDESTNSLASQAGGTDQFPSDDKGPADLPRARDDENRDLQPKEIEQCP